jgi:hypothetical protein
MPRRPATIERDIPLCLIPALVKRSVSIYGGRRKRVIVWESRSHFYNISIRTKPIRKERRGASARCEEGESKERDNNDTGPDDSSGGEKE